MTVESMESLSDEAIEQYPSPLSPARLVDLLVRPRKFFSNPQDLNKKSALLISAGIVGIASAMNEIDKKIIKAELGHPVSGWENIAPLVLSSWKSYWLVVVIGGLIGAVLIWYTGGWWYKKRLQWSGVAAPSPHLARCVYTFQGLVWAGPNSLITLIQTAVFANYREAWQANELWSSSVLVFVFLSCWSSYIGAVTAFQASKFKACFWFFISPALLYLAALGVIGRFYKLFGSQAI